MQEEARIRRSRPGNVRWLPTVPGAAAALVLKPWLGIPNTSAAAHAGAMAFAADGDTPKTIS